MSIEHIIPESLENQDIYLSHGIICDQCNNYLSRKVEKPILSSSIFRLIISNGAGKIQRHLF
ncbi:MAG: HNH endonuclease [Sedimentisphaerales bacterium]